MSILSDRTLLRTGMALVQPFDRSRVQPSSIDLTLGTTFRVPDRQAAGGGVVHLDGHRVSEELTKQRVLEPGETFILYPGEAVLGQTAETVTVPNDLVCHIDGKSSLGRLFLIVHATAGYVDPGFTGVLTMEMANLSPWPLVLYPGQPCCQVRFQMLDAPAARPYNGRYQGDKAAAGSRFGGDPLPGYTIRED